MKKSLITLAIAGSFAATANAQTAVSMYGIVDMGLVSEAGMPAIADPGSSVVRAAHFGMPLVLAIIGGIVGLFVTGQYLSVPSAIGFIAVFFGGIGSLPGTAFGGLVLFTAWSGMVRWSMG